MTPRADCAPKGIAALSSVRPNLEKTLIENLIRKNRHQGMMGCRYDWGAGCNLVDTSLTRTGRYARNARSHDSAYLRRIRNPPAQTDSRGLSLPVCATQRSTP
jgi:hypothetical protein